MIYKFSKNGHEYSIKGMNRFDAQTAAELMFGIKLKGAKYEEIYKNHVIKSGHVS